MWCVFHVYFIITIVILHISSITIVIKKIRETHKIHRTYRLSASNIPIIQLLLDHGANINIIDRRGKNALAYSKDNPDVIEFLLSRGVQGTGR